VIAFRSGGLTDIVEHERTGILVTPGVTTELAQALDDVLESPERAHDLAVAGRSHVLATLSPEPAAVKYADIYRDAIGQRET
jgi:glycosyltransferase involved in cell wall biosynthesis